MKHKAPVLSIVVLNGSNQLIGQGSNIPSNDSKRPVPVFPMLSNPDHAASIPTTALHKVLICSEEQFKVNDILIRINFVQHVISFIRYLHCPI